MPGRPERPQLVPHTSLKQRSVGSVAGRAALIHALAHIELNAIDLAADIVWRFAGLPTQFYRDWISVAREEAMHFQLLRAHLQSHGFAYGDFHAHNGLWEMAERTKGDLLARLALVPRTLEARGLDASPAVKDKLIRAGDTRGGEILDIVLGDEIGHVRIGNHWYAQLCKERGLNPLTTFVELARRVRGASPARPVQHQRPARGGFQQRGTRAADGVAAGKVACANPVIQRSIQRTRHFALQEGPPAALLRPSELMPI